MSLIPREARERRDDRDRERSKSPSPEEGTREEGTREEGTREEGTREVRMDDDDRSGSECSEERRRDDRRKRFRYQDSSSDSEMNFIGQGQPQQPPQPESSKAALNVVWATVDSGAATSCLPVELCQERGLAVERTSDLPYTNASGRMGFVIPRSPLEIRMDPRWLELACSRQWTLPNHCYQWQGL